MPIYEYQCDACGHELEAIQKMADTPLSDCPQCGKPALKRKISAVGFRLKGGGWYETDFKTSGKRNLAGDAGASSSGSGGGGAGDSGSGGSNGGGGESKAATPAADKSVKATTGTAKTGSD